MHLLGVKERFVATCIGNTGSADSKADFQGLNMTALCEKRWQVVLRVLQALLPMFEVLQTAWCKETFLQGCSDSDDGIAAGMWMQP